ncbi:hypothetical protein HMPREF1356_02728, partial [Enterococcus faecium C1904]
FAILFTKGFSVIPKEIPSINAITGINRSIVKLMFFAMLTPSFSN